MPLNADHRKRGHAAGNPTEEQPAEDSSSEASAKPTPEPTAELSPELKLEASKKLLREVGYFVVFLTAALLTASLPLPFFIGSALLNLGAVVAGIRVLRLGRKGGLTPLSLMLFGFGVFLTVLMTLSSIGLLVFWQEQTQLQDCLRGSVTVQGQDKCQAVFNDSIEQRLTSLVPGYGP